MPSMEADNDVPVAGGARQSASSLHKVCHIRQICSSHAPLATHVLLAKVYRPLANLILTRPTADPPEGLECVTGET